MKRYGRNKEGSINKVDMNKTRLAPSEKIQVYRKRKIELEDKIKEELVGLINDTKHFVNM